jgi:hypothetical protein
MSLLQRFQMISFCEKRVLLDASQAAFIPQHIVGLQQDCPKVFNVGANAAIHDSRGHRSFKGAVADEEYNRVNVLVRNIELLGYRASMPKVLPDWILKTKFLSVENLSPLRASLVSENPPVDVFGLDDKNSEPRNEHMIKLSRSVVCREDQVVDPASDRERRECPMK